MFITKCVVNKMLNDTRELFAYLDNVVIEKVVEIADKEGQKAVNEVVEEKIYANVDNSDFYENTFGLRDNTQTLHKKTISLNGTNYDVDVYIEPEGNYPSFYTGSADNSDNIVRWLSEGHKGFYKSLKVDYKGVDIFGNAIEVLKKEKNLLNKIKKELGNIYIRFSK